MQVENYMTDIIGTMRSELRDILRDSVKDYTTKPRDKWLFDWPSQIILVVNQIFWCQEVEEAFAKLGQGQGNAMKVCWVGGVYSVFLQLGHKRSMYARGGGVQPGHVCDGIQTCCTVKLTQF